jgi:hypothetical protein
MEAVMALEGVGFVMARTGHGGPALRLWSAADRLRQAMGAPMPAIERSRCELHVARARSHLGQAQAEEEGRAGRAMSMDEAANFALERAG